MDNKIITLRSIHMLTAPARRGVKKLIKLMAIEWAQHNINVNAIAPTFIETHSTKPIHTS